MISVDDLVSTARKHLRVKFRHQGRSPETGVDCVGLLAVVAYELGIEVIDDATYAFRVNPKQLLAGLLRHCTKDKGIVIKPGRIGLMRFDKIHGATHTVLLTDKGILHAYNKRGEVVEHRLNDVWRARLVATFTVDAVTYE